MRATVMYGAGDVRVENVPDAQIIKPTDALVRVTRACICGSDLWPYKSMEPTESGVVMGHEAVGVVESVGSEVRTRQAGRPRRHAVRVVGRLMRVLPRRATDLVRPRRLLRQRGGRRGAGRGGARAARGRDALRPAGGSRTTRFCRRSSRSRT